MVAADRRGGVGDLLDRLRSDEARRKYGAGKELRRLAERRPDLLAPHLDALVRLLDHPNKLLQWEAIFALSHVARADPNRRFEAVFDRYFAPIRGRVMITAANVIVGGARIAAARPDWADRVAREVRKVARARYRTAECRRIAIGHAITTFDEIYPLLRDKGPVLRFVRRQVTCARPATQAKAVRFLKRHDALKAPRRIGRRP